MRGGSLSFADDRSFTRKRALIVLAILLLLTLAFALWRFSEIATSSAGSSIPQNPPPTLGTATETALARQFRPYSDAVPVLALPGIRAEGSIDGIAAAEFAAQLAMLRDAGFTAVDDRTTRGIVMERFNDSPSNPILLTFDGAARSLWTDVDPILKAYGFSAEVFLRIDDLTGSDGEQPLNKETLLAMKASGRWSFGVQVDDQTLLRRMGEPLLVWENRVREELSAARDTVRRELDIQVISFAYPSPDWGLPQDDRAVAQRLPELVGEQFDLAFLDSNRSEVVTIDSDKSLAPRIPRSRTSSTPEAMLGAIDEALPRAPVGVVSSVAWTAEGPGSCTFGGSSLIIAADGSTTCRLQSNAQRTWEDLSFEGMVAGLSSSTVMTVQLRESTTTQVDLILGTSSVSVRHRLGTDWKVLADVPRVMPSGGASIFLRLAGSRLEVSIDGVTLISLDLGPGIQSGEVGVTAESEQAAELVITQLVVISDTPM